MKIGRKWLGIMLLIALGALAAIIVGPTLADSAAPISKYRKPSITRDTSPMTRGIRSTKTRASLSRYTTKPQKCGAKPSRWPSAMAFLT